MKFSFVLFLCFLAASAQGQYKSMKNTSHQDLGPVLDLEDILTEEEEDALEKTLLEFEKTTQSKFIVISVGGMEDFNNFDQFSLYLLDKHQIQERIGKNGLALIFSGKLRKIHLNSEMERRKIVEDSVYQRVVTQSLIPQFKQHQYYLGIQNGVTEILQVYKDN